MQMLKVSQESRYIGKIAVKTSIQVLKLNQLVDNQRKLRDWVPSNTRMSQMRARQIL